MTIWTPPRAIYAPPLTSHTGFTLGNGSTDPTMSGGTASLGGGADGWYPAIDSTPTSTGTHYSQVTLTSAPITHLSSPTENASGPIVRANLGMTQWVWAACDAGNTFIITMTSPTGGGATVRATGSAASSGNVVKLQAIGNVYTCFVNGVSNCTWTDSSFVISTSNHYCGLAVSHGNFNGSCTMSTLSIQDTYPSDNPPSSFATNVRSSTR